MSDYDYKAIDAVVNIWTPEALSHRPGWTDEFFVGKVKGQHGSGGISLEKMIEDMDAAGIELGFLIAAKAGACWLARLLSHASRSGGRGQWPNIQNGFWGLSVLIPL